VNSNLIKRKNNARKQIIAAIIAAKIDTNIDTNNYFAQMSNVKCYLCEKKDPFK